LISAPTLRRIEGMHHRRVSRATEDLLLLAIGGSLLYVALTMLDAFGHLAHWLRAQELIDEVLSLVFVLVGGVAVFSWRRWRELQAAQRELRILSGVIRVCAWCRKARHGTDDWVPLEDYVRRESEADLSPDLCPDCERRLPAPGSRRTFF
jgi:hypothetical protein